MILIKNEISFTGLTSTWLPGKNAATLLIVTTNPPLILEVIEPSTVDPSSEIFSNSFQADSLIAFSLLRTNLPSEFSIFST